MEGPLSALPAGKRGYLCACPDHDAEAKARWSRANASPIGTDRTGEEVGQGQAPGREQREAAKGARGKRGGTDDDPKQGSLI